MTTMKTRSSADSRPDRRQTKEWPLPAQLLLCLGLFLGSLLCLGVLLLEVPFLLVPFLLDHQYHSNRLKQHRSF